MIDREETYRRFGYYPEDLKPQSRKRIVVRCDDCEKIRVIQKKGYRPLCASCVQKGERSPMYEKHHSEKAKKKIPEAHKGERNHMYGKHHSKETKGKLPEAFKGEKHPFFGKHHTEEAKRKIREARKHRKFPKSKTKPELIFLEMCKKNNIDFQYTGDGSLWIGKKGEKHLNPDFIEANGKKIVVEIMGDYWHSPLLNSKLSPSANLNYRKNHYKKYGWNSIFIWESDLKRADYEQFVLQKLEKEGIEHGY